MPGKLIIAIALLAAGTTVVIADQARVHVQPTNELLMYVTTDKPLYRPGETVWFRSWEVSADRLTAATGNTAVSFELVDPKGAVVAKKKVRSTGGMATNDIVLDQGLPGGAYVLRVRSERGAATERRITVSTYERPRIKKTVELHKSSYGPGDRVTAVIKLESNTGEPLARAKVTGLVWLDGRRIEAVYARTNARGGASLRFALPSRIVRGDGLLTVMAEHGGAAESIQTRIPIVLDRLEIELRPEGGDLVEGLPSRVYFRARNTIGKPVDIRGVVVDDRGRQVVEIAAADRGMGRFELTPEAGRSYTLKVQRPRGIRQTVSLPKARAAGCVMRVADDFRSEQAELGVRVSCTDDGDVVVAAALRKGVLAQVQGRGDLRLPIPASAQGAMRVTVFGANRTPLVERVVYRGLGKDLTIAIRPSRDGYSPRDQVVLDIETRDASGKPVPAELALAVVDDTVLNLAGDKTGHILAQLYLQPELPGQRIDDPNHYFEHPEAMDLLMGTAGWRRLTWQWKTR
nr:MG2 domain-containing protein [uncultured Brevundimonas sp.]